MDLSFFSDFVDLEKIGLLSFGEKMIGSVMVTILGMGITFVGLVAIMFLLGLSSRLIIRLEARLLGKPAQVINQSTFASVEAPSPSFVDLTTSKTDDVDSETVVAIMAALTVMMQTSTSNIVIRNIKRVSPEWNKAGKIDQFASRF